MRVAVPCRHASRGRILAHVNQRPSFVLWWENLHVGVQVAVAFIVALVVLWFGHVLLLNQPLGRGFVYAIFWAVPVTVVVVGATRSERARRLRAEGRDAQ